MRHHQIVANIQQMLQKDTTNTNLEGGNSWFSHKSPDSVGRSKFGAGLKVLLKALVKSLRCALIR